MHGMKMSVSFMKNCNYTLTVHVESHFNNKESSSQIVISKNERVIRVRMSIQTKKQSKKKLRVTREQSQSGQTHKNSDKKHSNR